MSVRPPSALRSLAGRVKGLFVIRTAARAVSPRLRGKLRRAVVVPTPDLMFSEAVFILRDEVLREPGVSRDELLRQAARAAESYTENALPAPERLSLRPAAAFLLGAACALSRSGCGACLSGPPRPGRGRACGESCGARWWCRHRTTCSARRSSSCGTRRCGSPA